MLRDHVCLRASVCPTGVKTTRNRACHPLVCQKTGGVRARSGMNCQGMQFPHGGDIPYCINTYIHICMYVCMHACNVCMYSQIPWLGPVELTASYPGPNRLRLPPHARIHSTREKCPARATPPPRRRSATRWRRSRTGSRSWRSGPRGRRESRRRAAPAAWTSTGPARTGSAPLWRAGTGFGQPQRLRLAPGLVADAGSAIVADGSATWWRLLALARATRSPGRRIKAEPAP